MGESRPVTGEGQGNRKASAQGQRGVSHARTHGQPQHTRRARRCNARSARRHGIAIVSIGEDVEKNAVYPTRPDTGYPTPQRGVASSNV